ncbi:hypothetical protein Tco_0633715 [Tanacetum coccineum]
MHPWCYFYQTECTLLVTKETNAPLLVVGKRGGNGGKDGGVVMMLLWGWRRCGGWEMEVTRIIVRCAGCGGGESARNLAGWSVTTPEMGGDGLCVC